MKFVAKFFSRLRKIKVKFVLMFLSLFVVGLFVLLFFVFNFSGSHKHHSDERDNFLKLSSADLASDFDYYLDFMEKNGSVFSVALRLNPDLREKAKEYRNKILKSKSNFEQLLLIDEFIHLFFPGHSGIMTYDLNDFVNTQFAAGSDRLFKILDNVNLDFDNLHLQSYDFWNKKGGMEKIKEHFDRVGSRAKRDFAKIFADQQIFENTKKYSELLVSKRDGVSFKDNYYQRFDSIDDVSKVEFSVLKPDKIAYMKIPNFEVINASEKQRFKNFYRKISNYENLIIDLRNNHGGYLAYVYYLLPIFKKSFDVKNVGLFKLGPYFEKWKTELEDPFSSILLVGEEDSPRIKSVSELPNMPALDILDVEHATHFLDVGKKCSFVRKGPTDLDFHGKVYLLINGGTASAATLFTQMAISSKEVTVIGTPTARVTFGGWNVFVLPKSKVVVAYETSNVLNEDGSSQLEFGVKPNVFYSGGCCCCNSREDVLDWLVNKLESPGGFDANEGGGNSVVDMIDERLEKEEKNKKSQKNKNLL